MTDSANPTLTKIENIFQSVAWETIMKAGLTSFFASNPGFAIWPLGPMISYVAGLVSFECFSKFKLVVDIGALKYLGASAQTAFNDTMVKLKIIADEKGLSSPDYKKAKEDAKIQFSKYVSFNS